MQSNYLCIIHVLILVCVFLRNHFLNMYTGFSFCNLFIFDFNNNCLTIGDFCFMYETSSVGCQLYFRRKCLWSATKDNMCVYLMKTVRLYQNVC